MQSAGLSDHVSYPRTLGPAERAALFFSGTLYLSQELSPRCLRAPSYLRSQLQCHLLREVNLPAPAHREFQCSLFTCVLST